LKFAISPVVLDELSRRLDSVDSIIAKVGGMLREKQHHLKNISTKATSRDLVTEADIESEKLICDHVQDYFPADDILAEERAFSEKPSVREADFCWVVDPLDGTINYAHGLPLYCISIGLLYRNNPVAGFVKLPATDETYRAIATLGSYKDGKVLQVSQTRDLKKSLISTGFPYDREKHISRLMKSIELFLINMRGIRRTGSAAMDLCWVAEGRFDAFFELFLSPWDTCAGAVIVQEAGGMISSSNKTDYDMNSDTILASNKYIHEDLLKIVNNI